MSGDMMMSVLRDALISCIVPASARANHHLSATMQGPFTLPQDRVNIDQMEAASLNWDADREKNESMLDVVKQPIKHFYILKEFDKNV